MKLKNIFAILLFFLLVVSLTGLATYKIMNSRTFQFFGGITNKINTQDKVVALTFDDGPSPKIDTILAILNSEKVKATFFSSW